MFDRNLSIENIEGNFWSKPANENSLALRYHAARKKPIGNLTADEILLFLEQGNYYELLIPVAVDLLNETPFILHGNLMREVLRYYNFVKKPPPEINSAFKNLINGIPLNVFEDFSELQLAVEYFLDAEE